MKKAFTLIELLVVIAIIAILAAILFPVFAQAKEAAKKTQALTNVKQSGTAVIIYQADYDDSLPSAYPIAAGNACDGLTPGGVLTMQHGWAATTPAGADGADCAATDGQAWINSTEPYRKNYQITELPGKNTLDVYVAAYMATFIRPPATVSLSMNGLLHTLPQGEIINSSTVPLLWPGHYGHNFRGGMQFHGSPSLNCPTLGQPCRFNAGGPAQAGATGNGDQVYSWVTLSNSMWLYSQGFTYVRTDTSAKFTKVSNGRSHNQPHSYNAAGVFNGTTRCATVAGGTNYSSWFRPDTDQRSYPLGAAPQVCGF
ncbi:Prokaryotic N-terminal methylation site [Fimbriimonadaceae bacterium]